MSTLTKVLIVLLTIFSIFLCGIVVTYVANADNYKQKCDKIQFDLQTAIRQAENADRRLNQTIEQTDQQKKQLGEQINSLNIQIDQLDAKLNDAEREKSLLLQRVNKWTSVVDEFLTRNTDQGQLLKQTLQELDQLREEQFKQRKELKELTASFIQKMGLIAQLEETNKRLSEEKAALRAKLDQFLRQFGKAVVPPTPVTPTKAKARPAQLTRPIGLKAKVTAVDAKNSLAEISIGTANGVKEGMRFHVTRGDQYICDILILDVAPEQAVGALELTEATKQRPKTGDNVSTSL
ncbi:MAG: hypothetical protein AMJ75_04070 [Phycisphaerae bacterium SM1_79]|nr:MAG: hypothetical protein AMJ75_04070 [Phycisphaerae bacterium SM1_79]